MTTVEEIALCQDISTPFPEFQQQTPENPRMKIEHRYKDKSVVTIDGGDIATVIREYNKHCGKCLPQLTVPSPPHCLDNTASSSSSSSPIADSVWHLSHEDKSGARGGGGLRVFKQENQTILTIKTYMTFENVEPELIYSLACDLMVRKHWDPIYIQVKEVEQLSSTLSSQPSLDRNHRNSENENDSSNNGSNCRSDGSGCCDPRVDIIYTQLKMPFPVKNRDSCILRLAYHCDKTSMEKTNKGESSITSSTSPGPSYTVIVCKTTEHESCPVLNNGSFVRTFTPLHAYLVVRDESIHGCHLFMLSAHDPMGSIPKFVINMVMSQSPIKWYTELKAMAQRMKTNGWKLEKQLPGNLEQNRKLVIGILQKIKGSAGTRSRL